MMLDNFYSRRKTRSLAVLAIAQAMISNIPTEAEIDHAWHVLLCEFCAKGVPLSDGKHVILGAEFSCDAESQNER